MAGKFELYKDKAGEFRFRLKAGNGEIILASEGYKQKASAMNGTEGCPTWLDAESQLVAAADVIPFANNAVKTFGNGAEFEYPGQFVPTSLRMLAQ